MLTNDDKTFTKNCNFFYSKFQRLREIPRSELPTFTPASASLHDMSLITWQRSRSAAALRKARLALQSGPKCIGRRTNASNVTPTAKSKFGRPEQNNDQSFAFSDHRLEHQKLKSQKSVVMHDRGVDRPVPPRKDPMKVTVKGIDEARRRFKALDQIENLTERQYEEQNIIRRLKYLNGDRSRDFISWDDTSYTNFKSPNKNYYLPVNPYNIYLEWEAKMQKLEETDTRPPHKRAEDLLVQWEKTRKIARMRKAGFRFPENVDPLKYYDEDQIVDHPHIEYPSSSTLHHIVSDSVVPEKVLEPGNDAKLPQLDHGLDRLLFALGPHAVTDFRTGLANFPQHVQTLSPLKDVDYSKTLILSELIPKDSELFGLAKEHKKKYAISFKTLTNVLLRFHMDISRNRPPNKAYFSTSFGGEPDDYTFSALKPLSLFVRYHPETEIYSIEPDQSEDEEFFPSIIDKVVEKNLTKDHGGSSRDTCFSCDTFMVKATGTPCIDPRLPGSGLFNIKAHDVVLRRSKQEYIDPALAQTRPLTNVYGTGATLEHAKYDLCRSQLLRHSIEARLLQLDGSLIAYHDLDKVVGFEYMPLAYMDTLLHTHGYADQHPDQNMETFEEQASATAELDFKLGVYAFSQLLERIAIHHPKQSVNLVLKAPAQHQELAKDRFLLDNDISVLVNPMAGDAIESVQTGQQVSPPDADALARAQAEYDATKARLEQEEEAVKANERKQAGNDTEIDMASEAYAEEKKRQKGQKLLIKSLKKQAQKAQKEYRKLYYQRTTMLQAYRSKITDPFFFSAANGFRVRLVNYVGRRRRGPTEFPTPLPGDKWSAGATFGQVKTLDLAQLVKDVCDEAFDPRHVEVLPGNNSRGFVAAMNAVQTGAAKEFPFDKDDVDALPVEPVQFEDAEKRAVSTEGPTATATATEPKLEDETSTKPRAVDELVSMHYTMLRLKAELEQKGEQRETQDKAEEEVEVEVKPEAETKAKAKAKAKAKFKPKSKPKPETEAKAKEEAEAETAFGLPLDTDQK